MTTPRPAFYARTGGPLADFVTLLHLPYTMWHLSYVAIGAALATEVDAQRLLGTLIAFAVGLGVGAHALDELHDRPLSTALSATSLRFLGWGGLAVAATMALVGSYVISPVSLVWGVAGVLLAAAYTLEWSAWLHSTAGFAISWGAFPVLVGYWAQTESISVGAVVVAGAAAILSMAQRALSTPARHLRRNAAEANAAASDQDWDQSNLLSTWERPLQLLALAHVVLAVGLLLTHLP